MVQTKYALYDEPIEEYIDLVPILESLYYDSEKFCSEIDHVEVAA